MDVGEIAATVVVFESDDYVCADDLPGVRDALVAEFLGLDK